MKAGHASEGAPLRILIVEDSRTQAQRLRHVLKGAGYRVDMASDGGHALECMRAQSPDLVITDVNMPVMDGYELARTVKSEPRWRRTPVMLVTSMSDPQDVIRGLQCGADAFVLKPYEDEYLLARIRDVLANAPSEGLENEERVDIVFNGQPYRVPAGRTQALNLLLSTYEAAISRSRELARSKDALAQQAGQLAQRTAEADAANRAKSLFLATMSHEIRTPMNGMLGMLELLERSSLDAVQRETLDTVRASSASLLRVVNDILDVSKIEAGQLEIHPEPVSVVDIVRELERMHGDAASKKGLVLRSTLDPCVPPFLQLDGVRLRQILGNFIGNALKFTERGSIDIAVAMATREGEAWLRVEVRDTGIGISAEDQRILFQPFRQGDAEAARKAGGTGLGLTICRRLADLMGGTVYLDSEPGRGTTLTLELPAIVPEPGVAVEAVEAPVAAAPLHAHVLVVDDHPTNRTLLTRQLQALGLSAESADGYQALALWETGAFDLVLTDCEMPGMDGYALARAIREREAARGQERTPIIACTAHALAGAAQKCREAGMDDVLVKPVSLAMLSEKLARWLPAGAVTPAPAASSQAPASTVLDLNLVAGFWGDDPAQVKQVLDSFGKSARKDGRTLREAVDARDGQRAFKLAHKLLGSSRMVGAGELALACEDIEAAIEAGDWPEAALALQALDSANARLDDFLHSFEPRGD